MLNGLLWFYHSGDLQISTDRTLLPGLLEETQIAREEALLVWWCPPSFGLAANHKAFSACSSPEIDYLQMEDKQVGVSSLSKCDDAKKQTIKQNRFIWVKFTDGLYTLDEEI